MAKSPSLKMRTVSCRGLLLMPLCDIGYHQQSKSGHGCLPHTLYQWEHIGDYDVAGQVGFALNGQHLYI